MVLIDKNSNGDVLAYADVKSYFASYISAALSMFFYGFESVPTLFKLAAPSLSRCPVYIFKSVLPLLLLSLYLLPILTMHHIPLSKCGGL